MSPAMAAQKKAQASHSPKEVSRANKSTTKALHLSAEFVADSDLDDDTPHAVKSPPKKPTKTPESHYQKANGLSNVGLPQRKTVKAPKSLQSPQDRPKTNGVSKKINGVTSSDKVQQNGTSTDAGTTTDSEEDASILNGSPSAPPPGKTLIKKPPQRLVKADHRQGDGKANLNDLSEASSDQESGSTSESEENAANGQIKKNEKQSPSADLQVSESDSSDQDSSSSEGTDKEAPSTLARPGNLQPSRAPQAPTALVIPEFKPPPGFQATQIEDSGPLDSLFSTNNLAGKQIWHIITPASVPISTIKEIAQGSLSKAEVVVSHNEIEYALNDSKEHGSQKYVLFPGGSGSGYTPASCKVSRTLQLQQIVKLPHASSLGPIATASNHHTYSKPVPQQPTGLMMRYRPFGDVSEEDEEEKPAPPPPQFRMPPSVSETSRGEKRSSAVADIIDSPRQGSPVKKRKKDGTPARPNAVVENTPRQSSPLKKRKDRTPAQPTSVIDDVPPQSSTLKKGKKETALAQPIADNENTPRQSTPRKKRKKDRAPAQPTTVIEDTPLQGSTVKKSKTNETLAQSTASVEETTHPKSPIKKTKKDKTPAQKSQATQETGTSMSMPHYHTPDMPSGSHVDEVQGSPDLRDETPTPISRRERKKGKANEVHVSPILQDENLTPLPRKEKKKRKAEDIANKHVPEVGYSNANGGTEEHKMQGSTNVVAETPQKKKKEKEKRKRKTKVRDSATPAMSEGDAVAAQLQQYNTQASAADAPSEDVDDAAAKARRRQEKKEKKKRKMEREMERAAAAAATTTTLE